MEEERCKVLDLLRTSKLVLAGGNFCKVLTVSTAEDSTTLISNQEEADTKAVLHSHQAVEECESNRVLIWLGSIDLILFWGSAHLQEMTMLPHSSERVKAFAGKFYKSSVNMRIHFPILVIPLSLKMIYSKR